MSCEHDKDYIPQLYGRRQDKPLRARQAQLMETLLPTIAVPDPESAAIDLEAMFPDAREFWLEVGFGGGEHLAWQAAHNPEIGILGAEPFVNGVAKLLSAIDDEGLRNIRILHGDARPLIEALPEQSLTRIFVLHPDPWPKKRHFKRRIVSRWFFDQAARLLADNGVLRIASDIPDYVRWTLMHAQNEPRMEWTAECARDWRNRPADWPQTRYEAKALKEGRAPTYLTFRRLASST